MGTYASQTTVSSEKSRNEIEQTLKRYGATQFAYGWQGPQAVIGFTMYDRQMRFYLPLPDPTEREFTRTPTGRQRSTAEALKAHAQAEKQRWRALLLIVKAKLEAVESGIVTFEEEFAMHVVLPDNRRVSDHVVPMIEEAYVTGLVPSMLQIESA